VDYRPPPPDGAQLILIAIALLCSLLSLALWIACHCTCAP
jgi:hypothetical protein